MRIVTNVGYFSRKFINDHVVGFAKQNPSIAIYVRERPSRHPRFVAEFCKFSLLYFVTITPPACSKRQKPGGVRQELHHRRGAETHRSVENVVGPQAGEAKEKLENGQSQHSGNMAPFYVQATMIIMCIKCGSQHNLHLQLWPHLQRVMYANLNL